MGVGGVLYAAMLVLLLSPPKSLTKTEMLNHWFGCFYLLLFIFDTVSSIAYYAFGMELATTPKGGDRTRPDTTLKVHYHAYKFGMHKSLGPAYIYRVQTSKPLGIVSHTVSLSFSLLENYVLLYPKGVLTSGIGTWAVAKSVH